MNKFQKKSTRFVVLFSMVFLMQCCCCIIPLRWRMSLEEVAPRLSEPVLETGFVYNMLRSETGYTGTTKVEESDWQSQTGKPGATIIIPAQ